jgi:hypothetical protein
MPQLSMLHDPFIKKIPCAYKWPLLTNQCQISAASDMIRITSSDFKNQGKSYHPAFFITRNVYVNQVVWKTVINDAFPLLIN